MAAKGLRVFVSSTEKDLKPQRSIAKEVILGLGWQPVMMEYFQLGTQKTVKFCLDQVGECDLVIWIAGYRYGWVPLEDVGGDGDRSITTLELEYARSLNIPVLQFFARGWPWERVKEFQDDEGAPAIDKASAMQRASGQPAAFFDPEDSFDAVPQLTAFRNALSAALIDFKQKRKQVGASATTIDVVRRDFARSKVVPFIGCGAHGDAMSSAALAGRLAQRLDDIYRPPQAEPLPLPTVAEYLWRQYDDRDQFLQALQEELTKATAMVARSNVADLLAQQPRPPLIVSTTYDLLLEQRLADRKVAVVCHVVHTDDADHDGRVIVFRSEPGEKDRIDVVTSDRVTMAGDEWVIYKPLGSPLLHARLPPETADLVDTVVATETDYVKFLRRLSNEHTQIPSMFFRPLQQMALLFVGYGLDVWNLRLVMQVFQAVKRQEGKKAVRAVRPDPTDVERLLWRRLNVDVEATAPHDFAAQVMALPQPAGG